VPGDCAHVLVCVGAEDRGLSASLRSIGWFWRSSIYQKTNFMLIIAAQQTERFQTPGCHFSNCVGREIRMISVAQLSQDLPVQKVTDASGNPILGLFFGWAYLQFMDKNPK